MRKNSVILALFFFFAAAATVKPFAIKPKSAGPGADTDVGLHYSAYSERAFFDQAFDFAPSFPPARGNGIKGLLFNHHLLAPHFIAQAFLAAKNQKPQTLVIISPNHFAAGDSPVLTSAYAWQTPYGKLLPDTEVIAALTEAGAVKIEEPAFNDELGIKNVVAFAKRVFPDVRMVPLIIKDGLSDFKADSLAETLRKILPENSLIAGSFDFSHDRTLEAANRRDEKSLSIIRSLNFKNTKALDVDSRPGLRVLLEFLSFSKADSFTLLEHSNSALVAKNPNASSTTSYITGYFGRR